MHIIVHNSNTGNGQTTARRFPQSTYFMKAVFLSVLENDTNSMTWYLV